MTLYVRQNQCGQRTGSMSALTDVCQQVNTVGEIWRERMREGGRSYFGRCQSGHSKEGGRVETNEPRKETKETLLLLLSSQPIRPSQTERGQVGHHRLLHGQGQRGGKGEGWVWVLDTPYRVTVWGVAQVMERAPSSPKLLQTNVPLHSMSCVTSYPITSYSKLCRRALIRALN